MSRFELQPKNVDAIVGLPPGRTDDIVDGMKSLSDQDRRILMQGVDAINKGKRLSRKLSEAVMPIVEKLGAKADFQWARIYDEAKDCFWHPKVQEHYQRWKTVNRKGAGTAAEWARLTRGQPGQILRRLLGPDFKRVVLGAKPGPNVIRDLNGIPRPNELDGVTEGQIRTALRQADPKLLNKKLNGYYDSDNFSDAFVEAGHFSNAKGNIGEILGLKVQLELVENYRQAFKHKKWANKIQLITEIRIKGLEFTDSIIGFVDRRGNLNILGMTEIKNYADPRLGLEKAKEQFFRWLERNLDEGTEISFTYTDSRGRARRGSAVYAPGTKEGAVRGLYKSDKFIIFTEKQQLRSLPRQVYGVKGKSAIDMEFDNVIQGTSLTSFDKGNRTVGSVTAIALKGVTTAVLDYFAALTIKTKGRL